MANVVYCDTNDLCKNIYYFALSTPSSCNPTNLPTSHMGIANSGASSIYFASNALVANLNPKAPSVDVCVANGLPVRSVASATLASALSLPPAALQGHVMPSFPHTLIGLGPFANLGCQIIFSKHVVLVIHPMATASSTDGPNKMAPASGASLSRPPCQSYRNLRLEMHAFPDACVWRCMLRSWAHAQALPIPNVLPPAHRKPPSQSYRNLRLEMHAFPDACVWRQRMRSRAHVEALLIPNVLPPARCKPPSHACWCPRCLKNMRNWVHAEALPIFPSRLLLTQFSAPLHFPCLPRLACSQQLLLHNPIPPRDA
jgi:hypothetical protein